MNSALNKVKLIIIILFVFPFCLLSQNRWQFVNPQPTGYELNKIEKDMYGNLWICGEAGTLMKSSDEGHSWYQVDLMAYSMLYDISTVDNKIWVVGVNGMIFSSTDNGETWKSKSLGNEKALIKVQFINENTGWILTNNKLVFRTTNGGETWEASSINTNWTDNDMYFFSNEDGFIITGYIYYSPFSQIPIETRGSLLRTTDGGRSWNTVKDGTVKMNSIYFLDQNNIFISAFDVKEKGLLIKSSNTGTTWDTLETNANYSEIIFKDINNGIGIGSTYLGKTTNGGKDWSETNLENISSRLSRLNSIQFYRDKYYTVGDNGCIFESNNSENSWINLQKSLSIDYGLLRGVTFIDSLYGFVYGQRWGDYSQKESLLINTTDGGMTWSNCISPDNSGFYILKKHNNLIWATSQRTVYKSVDNGSSWLSVISVDDDFIRDIALRGENIIGIIYGKTLKISFNGGVDWTTKSFSNLNVSFLKKLIIIEEKKWFLLAHGGIGEPTFVSTDIGGSWNLLNRNFTSMEFVDDKIGYAIDSTIYKTVDGGNSWIEVNKTMKKNTYWTSTLFFLDESTGWIRSSSNLYFTNDAGNNWVQELGFSGDPNYPEFSSINILNRDNVWAVSSNGAILKMIPGKASGIVQLKEHIPTFVKLYQNFPNPFNPETTILYTIPHAEHVTLKVYDVLGREVATVVDEFKHAGTYSSKLNTQNYKMSSGIYFYRLQAGNYSETMKLILLK